MRSIWKVRQTIAREQIDIVHANDAHGVTLMRAATWGVRVPARVASRRVIFPIRSAARYRAADRVLCVSEAIRRVAIESGVPASQASVVYDGVDFARVDSGGRQRGRHALGIHDDTLLVLVVASLVECKGHRHLIDALPSVLEPHPQVQVVFAGDGDQRVAIETQIAKLELRERVRLAGFRRDVPDLLQACDLFVLPSLGEGLGTSAIDALACAKPVIVTTSGGLPEVLQSSRSAEPHGWIVPMADSAALTTAMNAAISDRAHATTLAERGRAFARERFSHTAMVEATLAQYAAIIAAKGQSP